MCHYWTAKYTLCGCICDDIYQLCPCREYCFGTVLTQTEYEDDLCWQCRETADQRTRWVQVVRGIETLEPEALADTQSEREKEGKVEKGSEKGDEGQKGTGGKEKNTDKQMARRAKLVTCDVSRVCDPEVIKRGRERVRRACFDKME
ncbi:uncharacterized protein ACHE_50386S [Aspergillus chevalieri]|uniref:Uncharacterized protein n=1 Tax=Aspergillus chevalieri TaxID=182096 RepID=A0A7R7VQX9_ASPCH|nr:uncharacterized protein ACHE_50386S [Aspergillus chevalieri]BCR89188.1 hypothetical protein ACHE_50386S [Aspergillus chevalieri]